MEILINFGTFQLCYLYINIFWVNHSTGALMSSDFFLSMGLVCNWKFAHPWVILEAANAGILPIGHHFPRHLGTPHQGGISVKNTTGFRDAL